MADERVGGEISLSEDNRERIRDFRQKYRLTYGEGHYIFALHAAFPVVFTPDLLYRIWVNFGTYPKRGDRETLLQIDSVAVSDLLLSNVCEEVGIELYAMDKEVRRYLLDKLEKDERFGSRRLEMLADFLYQYAEHTYRRPTAQPFKETHQWTALSVSRPKEAVAQIAGALAGAIEKKDAGEQLRLFMMIDTFARDERTFDELFQFSRGLKEHIYGNTDYTVQMPVLTRSPKEDGINLLSLPIPASLRGKIEREMPRTVDSVMDKIRKAKEENAVFLDLSALDLTEIPAEVFQLTQLETLVLSKNVLTTLPTEIVKLSSLKHLVLAQNRLAGLPDSIVRLEKLEVILLNENRLTDIPGGMFRLPQLGMVDLNDNLLTRLPEEITEPPLEIEWLDDISSGYGVILVQGNPLEEPPVDIVKQGKQSIIEYFKERKAPDHRLNEAKVMVLGDWSVGKTALINRLMGKPFDISEKATVGVNIHPIYLRVEGENIRLNIWDFGGQAILPAFHEMFLTPRGLYILVLDSRKNDFIDFWLSTVENFGEDSPILVVLNKIDEYPSFDINRERLQDKYPNIVGFYRTSCKTGEGCDVFIESLSKMLSRMETVVTRCPQKSIDAKLMVETLLTPYRSKQEFMDQCNDVGVTSDTERSNLLNLMNDVGSVVCYSGLPAGVPDIFNPEWVTYAVYKIQNTWFMESENGILPYSTAESRLLKEQRQNYIYKSSDFRYIYEIMNKFELYVQLDDSTALLPELLPLELDFKFNYSDSLRYVFQYDSFQRRILSRVIVRLYRDIKDETMWSRGILVENAEYQSQAVIECDDVERRINVYVNGKRRREYFADIRHTIRDIHSYYSKLGVEEMIPLPDESETLYKVDYLLNLLGEGEETLMAGSTPIRYSIKELLEDVEPLTGVPRKIFDLWNGQKRNLKIQRKLSLENWSAFFIELCEFLGIGRYERRTIFGYNGYFVDILHLSIGFKEKAICFFQSTPELLDQEIKALEEKYLNFNKSNLSGICMFFCFKRIKRIDLWDKQSISNIAVIDEGNLITLLLSKQPQETLRNLIINRLSLKVLSPYTASRITTSMFYGRSKILTRLILNTANSFAIVGSKKIGKTSLLMELMNDPLPTKIFVYIDLLLPSFRQSSFKSFFERVGLKLAETVQEKIVSKGFFSKQSRLKLHELIKRRFKKSGKKIIFIFDDADYLVELDKKKDYRILRELKKMSQDGLCQFIFAGSARVYSDDIDVNPLYTFTEMIRLGPLESEDALAMITQPMASIGVLYDSPADRELILSYTGNHPYWLQYFCNELIRNVQTHRNLNARRTIFRSCIENVMDEIRSKFGANALNMFFPHISSIEKLIVILLAEREHTHLRFSFSDIRDMLVAHSILLNESYFQKLPRTMVMNGIVTAEGNDTYHFAMPMFPEIFKKDTDKNYKESLIKEILSSR